MLPIGESAICKQGSRSRREFIDLAVDNSFARRKTQPRAIDGFPTLQASFKHAKRTLARLIFTFL